METDSKSAAIRNHSISRRLTFMNMLVSGVALLLASTAFFVYDWVTFREGIVHQLSIQTQITGSNTVSALLFDDAKVRRRHAVGAASLASYLIRSDRTTWRDAFCHLFARSGS